MTSFIHYTFRACVGYFSLDDSGNPGRENKQKCGPMSETTASGSCAKKTNKQTKQP